MPGSGDAVRSARLGLWLSHQRWSQRPRRPLAGKGQAVLQRVVGSGDVEEGERAQGAVCSELRSLGRGGAEVSVEPSGTWRTEGGRPWRLSLTGSRR